MRDYTAREPQPQEYVTHGTYYPSHRRWEMRVPSATWPSVRHLVSYTLGPGWHCTCQGFRRWGHDCRHILDSGPLFRQVRNDIIRYHDDVVEWEEQNRRRGVPERWA